ncbi:TetR family transcriptional regulator [uncultured Sphingomonas sp.]|uniref:TetR/AcrR family transcriptional regulator n=1 Tax=uncultured Sphingomonas sp. TaxID=158754 RepID=UPI0025DDDC66|nr:TetR family transcriptional regulator [uncultured Sphingomonas sp.]
MTDPAAPRAPRAPRQDAQRRRQALLAAAADAFRAEGYGVRLESIAEKAGVGRATLYRNFKDRGALAIAIFAAEVEALVGMIDPAAPIRETVAAMIRQGASALTLFARIAADLGEDEANIIAFRALGDRLDALLTPAVDAARARGELGADTTAHHIVLTVRMAGGLLLPHMTRDEQVDCLSEALDLLFSGLRPR